MVARRGVHRRGLGLSRADELGAGPRSHLRHLRTGPRETTAGTIDVLEFISLDGVVSDPSWTAEYGFPDYGPPVA